MGCKINRDLECLKTGDDPFTRHCMSNLRPCSSWQTVPRHRATPLSVNTRVVLNHHFRSLEFSSGSTILLALTLELGTISQNKLIELFVMFSPPFLLQIFSQLCIYLQAFSEIVWMVLAFASISEINAFFLFTFLCNRWYGA